MSGRPLMELTDAAAERVQSWSRVGGNVVGLRVGVKNGGCAGMSYTVEMAEEPARRVAGRGQGRESAHRSQGDALPDRLADGFRHHKSRGDFHFENPNETAACGCGESVSLPPAEEACQGLSGLIRAEK